ncbi:MAG: MFS transporter [bacterium]
MTNANINPMGTGTPSPAQVRGMRSAILAQSFGSLAQLAFAYGQVLVYLRILNIDSSRIVLYLAIPFSTELLTIPIAYWSDRLGKKIFGVTGLVLATVGFSTMTLAGLVHPTLVEPLAVLGIAIYSLGSTTMAASWYALLTPVIPMSMHGRFFAKLRMVWQVSGIGFAIVGGMVLGKDAPLYVYQCVLLAICAGQIIRIYFYIRIPEMERPSVKPRPLFELLREAMRVPGYLPYCAYVFLLTFFVSSCPTMFALVQKDVLALGDNQVVWLGGLTMVGSALGFSLIGRVIDRLGSKPIFIFCHLGYGAVILLFITRALWPVPVAGVLGVVSLTFGFIAACSSVALTTSLIAIIPGQNNRAVNQAVGRMFQMVGPGLCGFACAWVLKSGMLMPEWRMGSLIMSRYDTILLGFAFMIIMLVITLGLVPDAEKRRRAGGVR